MARKTGSDITQPELDTSLEEALNKAVANRVATEYRLKVKYNKDLEKETKDNNLKNTEFLYNYKRQLEERLQKLYAAKDTDNEKKRDALKRKLNEETAKLEERTRAALAKKLAEQEKKDKIELAKTILADNNATKKEKQDATKTLKQAITDANKQNAADWWQNNRNDALVKSMNKLINVMDDLKATFNTNMDTYAKYQGAINARTQGSNKTWQGMEDSLGKSIGTTPLVKLQSVYENLSKLVDAGIVYNVEQRAFLQTIAADIATTFDAANGTLLRLIRVQQSDTTAARLGMEAALTNYLNKNTYDTEYLNSEFDSVSAALLEASAQMSDQQAVEFEYVVQKWLGSLSSLGLSDEAATNIAKAIGYLGSGDIESLNSNTAVQNLLVMASNKAVGLNYSDMLTRGLDASTTNKLLKSIVTYIQEIASSDNKVVKSEYANVFGLSASDLTAVKNNLTSKQIDNISASMMSYQDTLSELGNQLNQIPTRISMAEMLSNLFDNAIWGLSSNIAENPVLYSLWRITSLVEDLTGGIALPTISVMGSAVDLNTTVTNLMRTGIVGISSLGLIGDIMSGIGSTLNPASMLGKISTDDLTKIRGSFTPTYTSGTISNTTSGSAYVGNSSGSDMYQSTLTAANDSSEAQKADAQKNDKSAQQMKEIHDAVVLLADPDKLFKTVSYKVIASDNLLTEDSAIFDKDNTVRVTAADNNASDDKIKSIESNVNTIVSLLQSVIVNGVLKVNVTNQLGSNPMGATGNTTGI